MRKHFLSNRMPGIISDLFVILVGLFFLAPLFVVGLISLDPRTIIASFPPTGISDKWYTAFFQNGAFTSGLSNSLAIGSIATVVSVAFGIATAYVLVRRRFRGKTTLTTFFLSPLIVPG